MTRFSRVLGALTFTLLIVIAFVPVALAAPVPWNLVDVVAHEEQGQATLIVSGTLADDAKLPADVELAVPAGAELFWAGEIMSGPASEDPAVQTKKTTRGGQDVYSFRLAKSRIGQVEVSMPPAAAAGQAALTWTSPWNVPEVTVGYRLPQGAQVTQPAQGAAMVPGPQGYSYYRKTLQNVKAGDDVSIAFAYSAPTVPAGGAAAPATGTTATRTTSDTVVLAIVIALALLAMGLLVMSVSRKMRDKQQSAAQAPRASRVKVPAASAKASSGTKAVASASAQSAPEVPASRGRANLKLIVVGVVAVGIIAAVVISAGNATSAKSVGGLVTREFGATETCTKTDFAITAPQGGDLSADAPKILDSLAQLQGLGRVAVDVQKATIEVNHCDSTATIEQIAQAIAATGYQVAAAPSAPANAVPATQAPATN